MGLISSIINGLKKTKESISKKLSMLFVTNELDEFFYEDLEAILLSSDIGATATDKIIDVVLVCKECDPAFQDAARKKNLNPTLWNELSHYTNPVIWMSNLIFFLNDVEKGNYSSQAIKKYKNILWETFPYVAREISEDENETARIILSI